MRTGASQLPFLVVETFCVPLLRPPADHKAVMPDRVRDKTDVAKSKQPREEGATNDPLARLIYMLDLLLSMEVLDIVKRSI